MSCDGSTIAATGACTCAWVAEPTHAPTPAKIAAAATANGQILRIRISPTLARRTALPQKSLHAAPFDQFSFNDDPYHTDVASAGQVDRRYRGRRSRVGARYKRYKGCTSAIHRRYRVPVASH